MMLKQQWLIKKHEAFLLYLILYFGGMFNSVITLSDSLYTMNVC